MDLRKCTTFTDPSISYRGSMNFLDSAHAKIQLEDHEESADLSTAMDVDHREIYFLIMHFLSAGPCQKTFGLLAEELLEHKLLPRRYHAWYSRSGAVCGDESDRNSFHLSYDHLVKRYPHVEKNHLVKLLKQLMLMTSPPLRCMAASMGPTAADVPTLLGTDSFSLLSGERDKENKKASNLPSYLRWPHMQADQVRGLRLREIGGGFSKHHRAPSIRFACYAIAKPSVLVPKMQNKKKLRGHRDAVYCAIFDRSGRYVITGSDDRLVKIWSMETAFCLASCRGHEGDITDLSVSSTNVLVASASNDYSIRVWRLPDGLPVSVLRGHTGAVTAIAFCPRPHSTFQLLSSSDDGTCRLWDARYSQCSPRVYLPKPTDLTVGKSSSIPSTGAPLSTAAQRHQILCCAFNANGTVFVTGSSDTFARVWNACKPSTDDIGQPSHEIDILAGHENDVNYVQFSGCAVAPRSSPADTSAEDNFPKFKNSWFSHDSIVTCSRDGSAIIWIPRSRRSHGKIGRWIRAYHLKVPPPPMPPQPPRGGPRQRLLPTPRGVNMIVWSLDNRFVLAAIMDNRICVWNANDGSLVHSLAGHTASTYVLDVHPFNPRIAMSAGYDGKTILWDIWEGTPIQVYEIDGRFKLVDGKFSQDGTSIVLSDDVGQIYLLNTGEGESQKDAKYDQFFLGDYRPLTQDASGNVIDQETQLAPYRRNVQDVLCDSSMLPYPEPYQSMYQRRRLGALGIEWRPTSIQFAIGTDIGIGQEFPILPVPDLDFQLEPLPDYLDALYLEPENDAMNDDNDSEYNVTEEYISDEPIDHSDSASSDSECSEDDKVRRNQKDSAWRSRKRKPVFELNLMTSSGRRLKKRTSDERGKALSRSKRCKKLKVRPGSSRKKSTEAKLLRPRRVAGRSAVNNFSQMTDDFTDEEDEDDSAGYSSTSESTFEESSSQRKGYNDDVNEQKRYSGTLKASPHGSEDVVRPLKDHDLPVNTGNKKKLVLKLSLNKHRIVPSGQEHQFESHSNVASSSMIAHKENSKASMNPGSSSASLDAKELPETYKEHSRDVEKLAESENELKPVTTCDTSISWGKIKLRTSNGTQVAKLPPSPVNNTVLSPVYGNKPICNEAGASNKPKIENEEKVSSSFLHTGSSNVSLDPNNCDQNDSKKKGTVIKIKTIKSRCDSSRPPVRTSSPASSDAHGERLSSVGEASLLDHPLASNKHGKTGEMPQPNANCDDNNTNGAFPNHSMVTDMPDLDTDSVRRSRSLKLKAPKQENVVTDAFGIGVDYLQPCTSRSSGKSQKKVVDHYAQDGWLSASKHTVRPRSSRKKGESYWTGSGSGLVTGVSEQVPAKVNWLLLLQQEEGYRYIPQMGDKVAYVRQGHEECKVPGIQRNPPWVLFGDNLSAVEICEVENLEYTMLSGSGCCKLSLKFLDSAQGLTGQKFKLILPELNESPDFVVEKTLYDAAKVRKWRIRDKCMVWWREPGGEGVNAGTWWTGEIIDIKDTDDNFPGSPWERYVVKYDNDTALHCPWELFHEDSSWVQPHIIDNRVSGRIMSCFTHLVQKASNKDRYGFSKLNDIVKKKDFENRFPVPLSPDIILGRLESNKYYRRVQAIGHDIDVMLSNAESYYENNSEYKKKTKSLSKWLKRELSELWK